VTGAGSGIGRALSLELVAHGAKVALADNNKENLAETEKLLHENNASIKTSLLDVADRDAVFVFAKETKEHFGEVNLVINNAGVALNSGPLWETSIDDFEWLMSINFSGVLYGTKAFLPELQQAKWGHIVNISSLFGIISVAEQTHYNASKFAVRGLTEALRHELDAAEGNVSCTSVHPGGIKTAIARNARLSKELEGDQLIVHQRFEELARTTPESAAQQILQAVVENKRRLLIGKDAKFLDWCQRYFPNSYQQYSRFEALSVFDQPARL